MKAVDTLDVSLPDQSTTTVVATISSDGKARVYDLARVPKPVPGSKVETIEPVGEYDSNGSRLVCLALVDSAGVEEEDTVIGKRKRGEDDPEGDQHGGDGRDGLVGEPGFREEESLLGSEPGGPDEEN